MRPAIPRRIERLAVLAAIAHEGHANDMPAQARSRLKVGRDKSQRLRDALAGVSSIGVRDVAAMDTDPRQAGHAARRRAALSAASREVLRP